MQKQKVAKTLIKDFIFRDYSLTLKVTKKGRFCIFAESMFYKVDCHANPLDLLAMTEYYKFLFDL